MGLRLSEAVRGARGTCARRSVPPRERAAAGQRVVASAGTEGAGAEGRWCTEGRGWWRGGRRGQRGAHMTPQDTTKRQATSALDGTLGRVRVKGEG